MTQLISMFGTAVDLGLVILGFSLIIVIHELGHFLAARWAGVRVLAFAVGFGPALVSFRKGLGVRAGSSESEYQDALRTAGKAGEKTGGGVVRGISPTEYRLNMLPLGGYVKMLGQDDADPSARSEESDSFQRALVWKRMVIISAGVVFNLISAALLFMVVFSVGLKSEPAWVGQVVPGSPAARAVAGNAKALGVTEPGLLPGDRIVRLDGVRPDSFNDVRLAAAMASRDTSLALTVERAIADGPSQRLEFLIRPQIDRFSRLLQLGIGPAVSGTLVGGEEANDEARERLRSRLDRAGLEGVEPGWRLLSVGAGAGTPGASGASFPKDAAGSAVGAGVAEGGESAVGAHGESAGPSAHTLERAVRTAAGGPVTAVFVDAAGGRSRAVTLRATPELQEASFMLPGSSQAVAIEHLLGVAAAVRVNIVEARSAADGAGMKAGDVLARVGDLEWPTFAEAIAEIRRNKRTSVPVEVARGERQADGGVRWAVVNLGVVPLRNGVMGFEAGVGAASGGQHTAIIARWPALSRASESELSAFEPAAEGELGGVAPGPGVAGVRRPSERASPPLPGGTVIQAVDGRVVNSLGEVREALRAIAAERRARGTLGAGLEVTVRVRPPATALLPEPRTAELVWRLSAGDVRTLESLGWTSPVSVGLFKLEETLLRGEGPAASVMLGLRETHRVMMATYLTFARLFEGTIRVEHLKGPVGIAHTGTLIADRGFIWLLFFMALISVNLAVINFLPLPIVDGGHMLFLMYEQVTGRPVSAGFQNVVTLAGLLLIGTMFIIVTFNDLANLFWR